MSASLPLLERASVDGTTFLLTPHRRLTLAPEARVVPARPSLLPDRTPGPGEQYRFHFDMGQCIGCKCCVVACNEQNGNPAELNWRRVGEIEGGWYPHAHRAHLSMGCNHCLEPTCLQGCPVDAYTKDPQTGIVRHSADACIGCQYCTWNCSYGVPQYNPDRGVVGKCDMCHGRLERGQAPACVSACPEGAIRIEIVNVADWRAAVSALAPLPGVPVNDASLSTTRVTVRPDLPPTARPLDLTHVTPAEPHWPLVVMTVLTQLSVGAFAAIWLLQLAGAVGRLGVVAIASLAVGGLALSASTLHLGRPIHAYRALKMWRRSWLSREVLFFTIFSGVAGAYAGGLWFGWLLSPAIGAITVAVGCAGVAASAYIYRVAARPAWHTPLTVLLFFATAGVLGPSFALAIGAGPLGLLRAATAAFAAAKLALVAIGFLRLIASDVIELRGTARLLSTALRSPFLAQGALLGAGGLVLPLTVDHPTGDTAAFVLLLAAEVVGRYLFFVSVVPRHMTTPYLAIGSEAA